MADTLVRNRLTGDAAARGSSRLRPAWQRGLERAVSGVLAAGSAAVIGLVVIGTVVLVLWAADSRSTAGAASALRFSAALWLLAHHAGFATPEGQVGLAPLGLSLLPLLLLVRAGRRMCAAEEQPALGPMVAAVTIPYAALAGVIAALAGTSGLHPRVWQAVVGGGVLAAVGTAAGAWREMRFWSLTGPMPLPPRARVVGRCAAAAGVLVLAAGAVLWGISLAIHGHQAGAIMTAMRPGASGAAGLLLAGLLLIPNAAIWGASVCLGTGFSVGAGTSVSPFGVHLGDVPALPLLAALPHNGVPPFYAGFLLAIPVGAGVLAGVLLVRRLPLMSPWRAARWGGLVAVPVALGAFLLAAISGGPAGPGRMATVGASPWTGAAAAAVDIGVPAALTVLILTWWQQRRMAVAVQAVAFEAPQAVAEAPQPVAEAPSEAEPEPPSEPEPEWEPVAEAESDAGTPPIMEK